MSRASQSAVQVIICCKGTLGFPNSLTMRAALLIQPVGDGLPENLGVLPNRLPNSAATLATSKVSGPVTLIGVVGVVAGSGGAKDDVG